MRNAITYSGPVRLYFDPTTLGNARWCIDGVGEQWGIHVRDVSITGVHLRCVYSQQDDRPLATSAWLEGRASVRVTDDGRAFLTPEGVKE